MDLGGYKVFMKTAGRGSQTVVIEDMLTGQSVFWDSVLTNLSHITAVMTYDRPGTGQSESSPRPRTNEKMAEELHALLKSEKIKPPYILVGSSYESFITRTFTDLYPSEVSGMVLVDPVHEDQFAEMKKLRSDQQWQEFLNRQDQLAASLGEGSRREWENFFLNAEAIREIDLPGNIPILIITSKRYSEWEEQMLYLEQDIQKKFELHRQWVNDNPNVFQIVTENSGHNITATEPQLVIDAILKIYVMVR